MALPKQKEKKNGGNSFVAMALPKQEEKKLLQLVCGNGITEIEGKKKKKIVALDLWLLKLEEKKILLQLVCGNGIAEIRGKKNGCNQFVAMALSKQKEKRRKKKCGN